MALVIPTTSGQIVPDVTVPGFEAAAPAASDQFFAFADGTEIGSTGKVADGAANAIQFTIDNGTLAAVVGNGLSSLVGGVWFDLGATLTGSINLTLTWITIINQTHVCVAVWRDNSAPTVIQDIEDATGHFIQIVASGAGDVSTFLKSGTDALASIVNENKSGSETVSYMVSIDANEMGPDQSKHQHGATSSTKTLGTKTAKSAGNWRVAVLFGKRATAGSEEVISLTLRGGMPA